MGTICSISIVFPDPTGPPTPTLGILLELINKIRDFQVINIFELILSCLD
jgi:hypothetical protein